MKILFSFLTIALFSSLSLANITAGNQYVLNHDGIGYHKAQLGTLVNQTRNLLVAKYSFAVQGGASTSDASAGIRLLTDLGDPKSYATLPNKAIITNVWLDVLTQPTGNVGAKIAINALTPGDLLAAIADTALFATFKQGVPTGATTTFIKMTVASAIRINPTVNALTAGKFTVFIEWVLGD